MKRKKLIILSIVLVVIILTIIFILIFRKKDNNDSNFSNKEQLLAVAYLENFKEVSEKYIDDFTNIKVFQTTGEELYLVIPRYKDIKINIYESLLEEEKIIKGSLIGSTSEEFILNCEKSNVIFEVIYKDNTFEYSPSVNDEKKLNTNKYISNITK